MPTTQSLPDELWGDETTYLYKDEYEVAWLLGIPVRLTAELADNHIIVGVIMESDLVKVVSFFRMLKEG